MIVMIVSAARIYSLNWVLTGVSVFFFTVALFLAGMALSG